MLNPSQSKSQSLSNQSPAEIGQGAVFARLAAFVLFSVLASLIACNTDQSPDKMQGEVRSADSAEQSTATDDSQVDTASLAAGSKPAQTKATDPLADAKAATQLSTTKIATPTSVDMLTQMQQDIDPSSDGWDSEVFAERAGNQLKHLGNIFLGDRQEAEQLDHYLASGFSCTPLRPAALEASFQEDDLEVRTATQLPNATELEGTSGFKEATAELSKPFEAAQDKHVKFKVFRVYLDENWIETTTYFELGGDTPTGSLQQNATWRCRWERDLTAEAPKLLSIQITEFSETECRNAQQTLFSDCTRSIFHGLEAFEQQLAFGIDYWRSRLENYLNIYYDGHHGLSVADVNGDGLDDLYVCEPGGLPNRLFLQQADGTLQDYSSESGIDFYNYTRSALFVDLDNDGDQDLILPSMGRVHLFENDGEAHFSRRLSLESHGQTAYSLAAADYDEDGDLDFYGCFYHGIGEDEADRLPAPYPYHDARTGGPNHLFRNEGNWKFRDATSEVGLDHNNDRWSFAAAWEDYDNDGDIDLYVVNDFGRNNLYRQEAGRFHDVAAEASAEDMNFGMSAAFGDFNRDGLMDIHVSNMFSSAGGRITFQEDFKEGASVQLKAAYQQMARGNTLLQNQGDGSFRDVSVDAGVTMGRWAWASLFADVNNDGWEDLLVANGFVTGKLSDDL